MSDAADLSLTDLVEGTSAEHSYQITDACYRALTEAFGDRSPVHVDAAFAARLGFEGRVMHGAIINGFISHFVGMVMPGRRALLLSTDIRYAAPSYLGDDIVITGTVTQRVESQATIVITVQVENRTRARVAARGRVQVRINDVD
jgi:3-hydroxybutyryl-CoA dehydratase